MKKLFLEGAALATLAFGAASCTNSQKHTRYDDATFNAEEQGLEVRGLWRDYKDTTKFQGLCFDNSREPGTHIITYYTDNNGDLKLTSDEADSAVAVTHALINIETYKITSPEKNEWYHKGHSQNYQKTVGRLFRNDGLN